MNGLDLVLVLLAVAAAVGGWRLGFLTRAVGWVGAGLGLVLAVAIVPSVVGRLELTSDTAVFLLGAAGIVLLASLGQGIGVAIGSQIRPSTRAQNARRLDAIGGSVLGIVGVAVLAWLVLPVMSSTQGWAAAAARSSAIARFTIDHFPEPPAQITDLERQLVGGEFPRIFAGTRRAPEVPPAPADSPIAAADLERLAQSTVRVEGEACGALQTGSGWVVGPDLVVTNAHVVAGSQDVRTVTPSGDSVNATVVRFDPSADLALLRAPIDAQPLPIAEPKEGDQGLVLGFPGGGPLDPSPFVVAENLTATGYDIYDRDLVERDLVVLSADLAPGDSGSAVVRTDGSVIGVAVAIAPDRDGVAYALNETSVQKLLAGAGADAVSTGACTR
ncbi:MAG: MarP family serine protease [Acidimicrobiales bacterium]